MKVETHTAWGVRWWRTSVGCMGHIGCMQILPNPPKVVIFLEELNVNMPLY